MPVRILHARPSQRNAVQHGHVVAHDRGLSHDDAGTVVNEDALAKPRAWMYVYLELLVHLVIVAVRNSIFRLLVVVW